MVSGALKADPAETAQLAANERGSLARPRLGQSPCKAFTQYVAYHPERTSRTGKP
jgi:hypothetical protein